MKKIKIDRAIQERPATRKQTRNEKIRQSLTEHVDVQVIPAITDREGYEKPKLRVCAYCRVSTDMDTQALSYELQVQNYTDYIRGNDEWQFAGIYADRGISGTSLKHRDEFNRMIEDCKAGKIDLMLEATYLTAMRRLVDSAEEVVEAVRDGTELALEPENKAAMERIDEETIQLQEAALALHKAKQRMEIGAVEYASRVKEYSERMKELEAERNELQGTAAKYAEVRMWLDTFIEQTMLSDTLTTVDGTTMKMLVDRIHVRNDGIVVEFKCGVAIEQEYVK